MTQDPFRFQHVISRSGTASEKWDRRQQMTGIDTVWPLWVADMDFQSPPAVIEALVERARHGIFGYPVETDDYRRAVVAWLEKRHQWRVQPEWLVYTPGVVFALHMAVQAFSEPGESVIIQPPVYHPFRYAIENNGRTVIHNPLQIRDGRYRMDLEGLRRCMTPNTHLLILCSPHNPVGRVWEADELTELGEICREYELTVFSDEIHADLTIHHHRHIPLASLSEDLAHRTVTGTSPNKTFNIPGLQVANTVIQDPVRRAMFKRCLDASGLYGGNIFGFTAAEAAYRHGEKWLDSLLRTIEENDQFLRVFLADHLPMLEVYPLEGTYLAWVDFRKLGMDDAILQQWLYHEAGVFLSEGPLFGPGGEGFQRINLACPQSILSSALEQLHQAVERRNVPSSLNHPSQPTPLPSDISAGSHG